MSKFKPKYTAKTNEEMELLEKRINKLLEVYDIECKGSGRVCVRHLPGVDAKRREYINYFGQQKT